MDKESLKLNNYISSYKSSLFKKYIGFAVLIIYAVLAYNIYKHNLSPFESKIDNLIFWLIIASIVILLYLISIKLVQGYFKSNYIIIDKDKILIRLGFTHKKQFNAIDIISFTLEPSFIKIVKKDGLVFKLRYHLSYTATEKLRDRIDRFNKVNGIE